MTITENTVKGKWREIKGEIQKAWGKLTDDDLEKTKGDLKSIGGLIQQKYGETEASYGKKVSEIFKRYETKASEKIEEIKKDLKN
jgi:uncharacterized protein YjbJ (UPF0337 family)